MCHLCRLLFSVVRAPAAFGSVMHAAPDKWQWNTFQHNVCVCVRVSVRVRVCVRVCTYTCTLHKEGDWSEFFPRVGARPVRP